MARKRGYGSRRRSGNRSGGSKRGKHASEVKHTAYLMGCVERGMKNPDSQISASYKAGQNFVTKSKKSLY